MTDSPTIKERLTKIETQMNALLKNDIPHMRSSIKSLRTRMAWIQGTIILALLGIIANLVV